MEHHAISLLGKADSWLWPKTSRMQESGQLGSKYAAITVRLISTVIQESSKLEGTLLLDRFWVELGEAHDRLKSNIAALKANLESFPVEFTTAALFDGVPQDSPDFSSLMKMAQEIWTHLAVAFMNPGGKKSGSGTAHSVDDLVSMETDALLKVIAEEDPRYGGRRQDVLKQLALRRDGGTCLLTGAEFSTLNPVNGLVPILAHVVPHSVHKKPDTLKLIAMFAGPQVAELAAQSLNKIGNVMNVEANAHTAFDSLQWGIEAKTAPDGTVSYIYRRVVPDKYATEKFTKGPGFIRFYDGDQIPFGSAVREKHLGWGRIRCFATFISLWHVS